MPRRGRSPASFALRAVLAVLLLHGAPAAADTANPGPEPLGVLAVASPPGPSAELAEIASQVRTAIAAHRAGVLDAAQLRTRMTGQRPGATLEALDGDFEDARAASSRGDHEGAVRLLRILVEELEQRPDGPETFRQWTRAVLRLARAELELGRPDAARALVERLVRAAPDLEVDPNLHPPRLARMVEEARASLRAEQTHALLATSPTAGVRVYVGGRAVGTAPVRLLLARGRYRVSAERAGLRAPPMWVDLRDQDQQVALDFSVPESMRPDRGPGLALSAPTAEERYRGIAAAASYLGLAEVVAVRLSEEPGATHVVGTLHDARRGIVERQARVRLVGGKPAPGAIPMLAGFLLTGTTRDLGLREVGVGSARPVAAVPAPQAEVEVLDDAGRPVKDEGVKNMLDRLREILQPGERAR